MIDLNSQGKLGYFHKMRAWRAISETQGILRQLLVQSKPRADGKLQFKKGKRRAIEKSVALVTVANKRTDYRGVG